MKHNKINVLPFVSSNMFILCIMNSEQCLAAKTNLFEKVISYFNYLNISPLAMNPIAMLFPALVTTLHFQSSLRLGRKQAELRNAQVGWVGVGALNLIICNRWDLRVPPAAATLTPGDINPHFSSRDNVLNGVQLQTVGDRGPRGWKGRAG